MNIPLIALLLCMFLPGAALAQLGTANLSSIKGDVQILTEDTEEWVAASINMPVQEGDRLWVPEGARAELHVRGGVYVRLGSATALDILALEEESFQFYLNGGHAYINNRKGGAEAIRVDTPRSSVECFDNSLVMIDVAEDGGTEVAVLKGSASAETPAGTATVDSGTTLHLGADRAAEVSPVAPPDEWETWNRERDRKIAAGSRSLRYIPDELDDYAYQLDDHGKWVYITDYGYCWTPLSVQVDWSPYRTGRWTWIRGQYVWISHEPWGWIPHHYGRWTFVDRFGWCWVPPRAGSVYWSPGYVGWVQNPSYVAWVPLAPGEIYYGRGYYGPNSVNITTVNVDLHLGLNFRNVSVRSGVTVVDRSAFAAGRRHIVKTVSNPFTAGSGEIGPPAFRPGRLGTRPIIKEIPVVRRPPERVRRVSVQELRKERVPGFVRGGAPVRDERPGRTIPVRRKSEPQNVIREQHPAVPTSRPPAKIEPSPAGRVTGPDRTRHVPRRNQSDMPAPAPAAQPAQPAATSPAPAIPPAVSPQREPKWQEPTPGRRYRPPRQEAPAEPTGTKAREMAPQPGTPTPQPAAQPRVQPSTRTPHTEAPAQERPQHDSSGSRSMSPRRAAPGDR